MVGVDMNGAGSIGQQVECPRCGHRFELSETFRAQFEAEKRSEIDAALRENEALIRAEMEKANQAKLSKSAEELKALKAQLKDDKEAQEKREAKIRADAEKNSQELRAKNAKQVRELEARIKADQQAQEMREAEIRTEMEKANQAKLSKSAEELEALKVQLKDDKEAQEKREAKIRADAEKNSQELRAKNAKQVRELEARIKADQLEQKKREAEIRAEAEKANQTKLAESDKHIKELVAQVQADKLAQQKREDQFNIEREEHALEKQRIEKQMNEMQRQLKQGSVELQGEALEVYLKRRLREAFPFDKIDDIARGRYGADLTHEVFNAQLGSCGLVVWEAKRTKHWNDSWLAKIKDDADRVEAHLRVIVSEALPADIHIFALKEGVWICSIDGAIPLAYALRSQLLEGERLQRVAQGKGLKMDEIYQYLTSPRFGERIQRMVETWQALEKQVDSEERSMRRQWKERRKQLARMQDTTIEMFTDFSAILGQEIAQVPGLELEALPAGDSIEVIDH